MPVTVFSFRVVTDTFIDHIEEATCRSNSMNNMTYTEIVEPVPVPKRPLSMTPTPYTKQTKSSPMSLFIFHQFGEYRMDYRCHSKRTEKSEEKILEERINFCYLIIMLINHF